METTFGNPLKPGSLESIRENILSKLLIAITVLAIPPLAASLYRSVDYGWQKVMYFHVIAYVLICITAMVRRKIPYLYKAIILILLCFLVGVLSIVKSGLLGSGFLFLMFSIILATMFLGVRFGGLLITASLVLLITEAIGIKQGWILFDFDIENIATSSITWILEICVFTLFTAILIFSLGRLIDYLVDSSDILRKRTLELKLTNEKVLEEIEEKKRAEENSRKSEEKYRFLYENATEGICIVQDGLIKFPNPQLEAISGYSGKELTEKPFFDFIHPEYRDMVQERHIQRLKGEFPPNNYAFRIITKDDREVWVQGNAVVIEWEGRPASLTFIRDITQQKELEVQLQQAQKMESIGTLAGGIAHDFNNILSPIMAYSELSMMDLPEESPVQENLQNIYKAGERARALVKQILSFARKSEEDKIPLKASLIIKEAIRFLRSTIPSTIDIRYEIATKQDRVNANPTQMNQIIMNLCTNAAHAMREKGGILEIAIDEKYIDSDEARHFIDMEPGGYLRLSVKDTGTGIPPKIVDKIFDPYFTTKDVDEGTGMGLSVVHGIVKQYGGNISVESEVGRGTTFHVLLPLIEVEDVPLKPEIESTLPLGREHILVVDDEKSIVNMTKSLLKKLGYTVSAMTGSYEALNAFRNKPEKYDLIITDMTMPGMTGKELARELMAVRPDIPVILCTGFSSQIDERLAKKMGIQALLFKPIIMRDLANIIREVLDKIR